MPEQAVSSADDQPMFQGRFASIANELDLGDEYFWTPNRLEPFEHWIGHIPFIFWLMKTVRPRRFVELGTHRGNSYCAMCQAVEALNLHAVGMAVDTWQGDVHMAGEAGLLNDLRAYHDPRYGDFSTLRQSTFDEARPYVSDGSLSKPIWRPKRLPKMSTISNLPKAIFSPHSQPSPTPSPAPVSGTSK